MVKQCLRKTLKRNHRRRHFQPPSDARILFILLQYFDVSYKDLNLSEKAEQRRLRRHLQKGSLTDEDTSCLVKGFQKAEGICSESTDWPPWFFHHLSWLLVLYKAVLEQLPTGTRVTQNDFLRFMAFNLAAPLGASTLNRFHLISEANSPIVMGHQAMNLLGLNCNPIPLSVKERDLPLSVAMRSLRRAKLLKNFLKGKSPYKSHLSRWMKGDGSADTDALNGCMKKIEGEVKQRLWKKSVQHRRLEVRELHRIEQQLLNQAQAGKEVIQAQIEEQVSKAQVRCQEKTVDLLFQGICVRLRFLAGVQRILIQAKKEMGKTLYRDLLSDLSYWFHVPQNDRDIRCDGVWVEQPDRLVFENREYHVSKHVDPKGKRYLDWLARYGSLQEQREAADYAQYWVACLKRGQSK